MHVNETTFLHLINCVGELLRLVDRQQCSPGPWTHDEQICVRKAAEVRSVAMSEAKLAGIMPHTVPEPKP